MPYITEERRQAINAGDGIETIGEFNYIVSNGMNLYIQAAGLSYDTINSLVGVLECAKLELYRKVAAPYEDQKEHDNGSVYEL